jgi:trans-2,3-dihydro-3-hydroxyanthranilate isomerase
VVEDRAAIAAALGLEPGDLIEEVPVQEVSCGVQYLMVPLRDREAVDRATARADALLRLSSLSRSHPAVFLFAIAPTGSNETTYSRMFAPGLGVLEDPATGSAAGPLGCYLVQHRQVSGAAAQEMVGIQGVKSGRASRLHMSIAGTPDAITGVRVGGEAVLVARGEFLVGHPFRGAGD